MTLVPVGNFLFRYRNLLVPVAFALVFLPGPRIASEPLTALAVGAALALLGQCVRAMTIGLKYIVRGGCNRRVFAEDLVTDGVYAHTRNPMYLGNLLILSGIAVASNSWTCVLLAVPLACFAYAAIAAAEERFLREKFASDYDAYARAVPRWTIAWHGLAATLRASEFHWRRLLVKEYGTTAAWLLAISITGWIAAGTPDGSSRDGYARAILIATMTGAALLWACARWLKKSRIVLAD